MPCVTIPTAEEEAAERNAHAKRIAKDTYEPMLCSACRVLERLGFDFDENPQLSVWWDNHKHEDAVKAERAKAEHTRKEYQERIAQEALKKPLGELSVVEKNLLKKLNYL